MTDNSREKANKVTAEMFIDYKCEEIQKLKDWLRKSQDESQEYEAIVETITRDHPDIVANACIEVKRLSR
jgi:hypothetical protein